MKWWNQLSYRVSAFIILLAIVPLAGFGITTINDFRQSRLTSVAQIHRGIISRNILNQKTGFWLLSTSSALLQIPLIFMKMKMNHV